MPATINYLKHSPLPIILWVKARMTLLRMQSQLVVSLTDEYFLSSALLRSWEDICCPTEYFFSHQDVRRWEAKQLGLFLRRISFFLFFFFNAISGTEETKYISFVLLPPVLFFFSQAGMLMVIYCSWAHVAFLKTLLGEHLVFCLSYPVAHEFVWNMQGDTIG